MLRLSRKPAEAPPQRMGTLAKLPVFYDLDGKRAIVAGGGAGAAWKAELLAAAGAHVDVYAVELSEDMLHLLERGAAAGALTHRARPWALDVFAGAAMALADVETDSEAQAFFCAARAAGVPVNVVDKPSFCEFQFGAIVNRSPTVVAISTDGAAPILGQAIRRRIEVLLPPALAEWTALARDVRARVMSRLPKGPARRQFWEAFAERAFGAAPSRADVAGFDALIDDIGAGRAKSGGRVTLVGAGPGDAELLTLKAVRALQSADVILFDDLVSDAVLELARREAKRMVVGKRGNRESCSQSDINALLLKLAAQGKHVVRLKCGDPMIFGRAGEEIAALEAAGIPVTVVPGISAGVALASSLGVSLTHRDFAQSVRFVTGHSRHGALPDLDWRGLADPATTLVFYMGGRTAPAIAEQLIAHGLDAATPVVVAAGVGCPDEIRWCGTLAALPEGAAFGDGRPVIIAIGRALAAVAASARAVEAPMKAIA